MYVFLLSVIILVAILLVLVILAQNSKGGGLSSQFGGSGASNMIGVKKTGDLLEKITWGLCIVLMVLVMSSSILLDHTPEQTDDFMDRARQEQNFGPGLNLGTEQDVEIENEGGLDDLEDAEEAVDSL